MGRVWHCTVAPAGPRATLAGAVQQRPLRKVLAAVQPPASSAAEHRHSNSAALAGAAPKSRATATDSRVEPQPQWPGAAQLAAKPGAELQRLVHHSQMLCLQGPRAQGHCCAAASFC